LTATAMMDLSMSISPGGTLPGLEKRGYPASA
jgi:hypothetical protein